MHQSLTVLSVALTLKRLTACAAFPGGDHPGGVRAPPAGHSEDRLLYQPGLVQAAGAPLPALRDAALLRGLGGAQGRPGDQPGRRASDKGRGGHRLGRGLRPGTLQRHGQVLRQGLAGAEEGLQEGDSE